jgi:hypothetical protein
MEDTKAQEKVHDEGHGSNGRSPHRATGVTSIKGKVAAPDPEVPEKKPRCRFTAHYKLRILEEADA